jgi:prepilin-type N-terminal cleavage/methylation domain-containing protein
VIGDLNRKIGRTDFLFTHLENREIGRPGNRENNAFVRPTSGSTDHTVAIANRQSPITNQMTRSPDQAGFTLFEVLLSITLIGLLMVALLIGLRVANRAWRTGEARLRRVHAEAERNAFVVEQISSLVPYQVTLNDPNLPGTFIVLQASATCLRFVSSYSSVFRGRSGLVLAEYGIVEASRGNVEVALRETPVGDSGVLFHRVIQSIKNDPDTGAPVIIYQPFLVRATDLPLMTGLRDAWFEYLDLHPEKGAGSAEKGAGPVWRQNWKSRNEAPYPEAIRFRWEGENQAGEEVIPVRAKFMLRPTPEQ